MTASEPTTQPSRYVVGMDLGTTNSAVAYVDTQQQPWRVASFPIPQLVAPAEVEARDTLPSFHYQPAAGEFSPEALRLPWGVDPTAKRAGDSIVGFFARDHGALVPGRMIASAKSWLCHTGVDRTADLLPWHGATDVDRLSPVEVTARYLRHVCQAWDAQHPADPLAQQDFVLTLPASFDEVARELTVEAAALAGLPRVVLIEEPQAAFYAWIYRHADSWEQSVSSGQKILVCDIGGGTSDFTLIRVRSGESGKVHFHRVAVGDHLILGGDNQDLALAHHLEQRLSPDGKLDPRQWDTLVRTARRVKETLLGEGAPERMTVQVASGGSRLFGALQTEVSREEVQQWIVEGFLPRVELAAHPSTRQSGFQEFGLPYATDAAITRYLAAFLSAHRNVTIGDEALPTDHDPARPDIVLFNGGFFASPVLRERLLEVLSSWFNETGSSTWQPLVLDNDRLDLAVARGAAYYGMVRRGEGVRIAADLARTYYLGVESEAGAANDAATEPVHHAICLVPASAEAGQEVDLRDRQFQLRVSEPVEFPLFVSSTRLTDKPGEVIVVDSEQLKSLPPIRTVLRSRGKSDESVVGVELHARLTEIGTLDLWCAESAGPRSWKMQFDIRSTTQTDLQSHEGAGESEGFIDEATWAECRATIEATFGAATDELAAFKPESLLKQLARILSSSKQDWPMSLLRRIWETLIENEAGRKRSITHEAR
ncbi:MAG: Hsp70 family protein, partial [Planctomycetota bacterium]|nr:Hsp70 family protein [Planctomycetota bacterium]